MEIHVVRAGETLYTIARSYSVDETILREANGVPPGGALAVGQTLVIQHPQTLHIVQPGQNLFGIARLYNLTLRQLYRNNYFLHGLPGLREGQVLVIAWADSPEGEIDTNGYAYPFISRRELSSTLPYMSYLTPFTYGIDAQGSLLPLEDGMLLEEAGRLGAAPMMHLSSLTEDDNFSSERAVWVLTRPELQAALIRPRATAAWTWTSSTSLRPSGRTTPPLSRPCGTVWRRWACRWWWPWPPRPTPLSRGFSTRPTTTPR